MPAACIVPPKGYFEKVNAILAKYDIRFIADEVICGFGRTGNWFGIADLRHEAHIDLHGQGHHLGLFPDVAR